MAEFAHVKDLNLRAMGFCGIDDTISPEILHLFSTHYTWIEWGILFQPELEGSPRYPTVEWVEKLVAFNKANGSLMRLAGHLCKARCVEVLNGNYAFAKSLAGKGFGRLQVNATLANGVHVDAGNIEEYVANIRLCMAAVPEVEWIIQVG